MKVSLVCNTFYKSLFLLALILVALMYFFGLVPEYINYVLNSSSFQRETTNHRIVHQKKKKLRRNLNSSISLVDPSLQEFVINGMNVLNATELPLCPKYPPNLVGEIPLRKSSVPTIEELESRFSWLKPGGHYAPENCRVLKKVAIVIPFRYRREHLLIFLQHMHPFLKKQQLDYTIFIIEQDGDRIFNKGVLMNAGYIEALKRRYYDCFIFHDVDLLPENDKNLYTCPIQPRHMSVGVDTLKYELPYKQLYGGVTAISTEHFRWVNGFSNSFLGWGGEDDDMTNRLRRQQLYISRYPAMIAKYTMLTHRKATPNPNRHYVLKIGQQKYDTDGLNNLEYLVVKSKDLLLYTWILVNVEG